MSPSKKAIDDVDVAARRLWRAVRALPECDPHRQKLVDIITQLEVVEVSLVEWDFETDPCPAPLWFLPWHVRARRWLWRNMFPFAR